MKEKRIAGLPRERGCPGFMVSRSDWRRDWRAQTRSLKQSIAIFYVPARHSGALAKASEPGIHNHRPSLLSALVDDLPDNTGLWLWIPGSALSGCPGMTCAKTTILARLFKLTWAELRMTFRYLPARHSGALAKASEPGIHNHRPSLLSALVDDLSRQHWFVVMDSGLSPFGLPRNDVRENRNFGEALQADLGGPVPRTKILRLRRRANQIHLFRGLTRERGGSRSSRTLR